MGSEVVRRLRTQAAERGFDASLTDVVGDHLCVLAAAKPGGRILGLGTGVGSGSARLLEGMDPEARLVTVEQDAALVAVAQAALRDSPARFVIADAAAWLAEAATRDDRFDLVFADSWPGKFSYLDEALGLVAPGGGYVVDELLPQPTWPHGHAPRVDALMTRLRDRPGWATVFLDWGSRVLLASRMS